jgi:hypothetical protein
MNAPSHNFRFVAVACPSDWWVLTPESMQFREESLACASTLGAVRLNPCSHDTTLFALRYQPVYQDAGSSLLSQISLSLK